MNRCSPNIGCQIDSIESGGEGRDTDFWWVQEIGCMENSW